MQGLTRRVLFFLAKIIPQGNHSVYKNDFDDCAATYDSVITRKILSAVTQNTIAGARLEPGMRCIDIGCGTGDSTFRILSRIRPGGKIFACDFSPQMTAAAQARINSADAEIRHSDMLEFLSSFADGSIDFIGSFWSLEYCDHYKVLAQSHRVLKPGGTLCVIVNHSDSLEELQSLITPILIKNIFSLRHIPPLNMIAGTGRFDSIARKAGFRDTDAVTGTSTCRFPDGEELVSWIKNGGPAAGLRGSIRKDHQEKIFTGIKKAADRRNGLTVTFKYTVFTGTK